MKLSELLERRSQVISEMRGITASPSGDGGDLSAEQSTKFDSLKSSLESIEKNIERQRVIDEAERRMNGEALTSRGDGRFDDLCREASLTKAIAAMIDPRSVDAGREIEISKELARRSGRNPQGIFVPLNALVEKRQLTIAGDGQYLKATDVLADQFIDALRPATVLGALGARFLTGLRDDIAIPKMDALTPAAEWLPDEGTSLTGGDHSFTQVTGSPHHVGLMTQWSRKVLLQSNPSIEQLVRADFSAKLAAAVDLAGLTGSGSYGQPEGILTNSSINEETLAGNAVTWADVLNMIAAVLTADVRGGRFGFTFNAYVQAYLRKTVKEAGGEIYIMEQPNSLAGYPVQITSQMDGDPNASPVVAGKMLFGDFSQVILAFWGDTGADILVNPYADSVYSLGHVLIRAFVDCDVLIRHPEGFCFCQGITL